MKTLALSIFILGITLMALEWDLPWLMAVAFIPYFQFIKQANKYE